MQQIHQEISEIIEKLMREALRNQANIKQLRQKDGAPASEDDYILAWAKSYRRPSNERIEVAALKEIAAKYKLKPRTLELEEQARVIIYQLIASRATKNIEYDRLSAESFISSLGSPPPA